MKRTIAIVAGGDSSEREVSHRSAQTIYDNLDKDLYEPYIVDIHGLKWQANHDGMWFDIDRNDFSFTLDGEKKSFSYAYMTIHGKPGENGVFEGYLQLMGIPFSTCNVMVGSLTFNKFMLNQTLKSFGVKVADSILLRKGQTVSGEEVGEKVGFPCFIKPSAGGSSFGTTKVSESCQVAEAISAAFKEDDEVVIEAFMDGIEVTNGYYRTSQREVTLPVTEVVPKTEFFDYDAKYNGLVSEITPARIPDNLRDRIQRLTAAIYDILGCHGIIRNDYIITEGHKINLLEVNTTPGMTATSFIPQQLKAAGMNLKDVLSEIIEDSFI